MSGAGVERHSRGFCFVMDMRGGGEKRKGNEGEYGRGIEASR